MSMCHGNRKTRVEPERIVKGDETDNSRKSRRKVQRVCTITKNNK